METISNRELRVTVSPAGAEVQSIKGLLTGREYLWQGDGRWWGRRSPLLFPIVGGLWNGTCRIGGRSVSIPKHGILRDAAWAVVCREENHVRFRHTSTVADFAVFPYAFVIEADYRLNGRRLDVTLEVTNPGGADLWFQVGGHPGFALPDWDEASEPDGYLRLEGDPQYVLRAGEQGCLEPERHAVPADGDGLIPLSVETFAHEALIFPDHQVKAATVLDRQRRPLARVESGAGAWLFWNPQGQRSPFVCCEPWYGLCDSIGFCGAVEERTLINHLRPGETWRGGYAIEVFEA